MSDPGYIYLAKFLHRTMATSAYEWLMNELDWVQRENTPRKEYWQNDFSRPYTYGWGAGIRTYEAQPVDMRVLAIRDILHRLYPGVYFEGCFLNRYDTARDALGWHADDDPGIDHTKPIAVISLGSPRWISVRTLDRTWSNSFHLQHGSLFLMPAGSQHTHQHQILKSSVQDPTPRISLTYRGLISN